MKVVYLTVIFAATAVIACASVGHDDPDLQTFDESNFIAFVGRRISVQPVPVKPNTIVLSPEYRVRAEVLEVLFGHYSPKEIEFSSFVHIGSPTFDKHEFGVAYVSREDGRLIAEHSFQPLYPTSDGRLASCGDPYVWMPDDQRHGVKAEPVIFKPPVTLDARKKEGQYDFPSYEAPYFRVHNDVATCLMGNYPKELFQVVSEGFLKTRNEFVRGLQRGTAAH